MCIVFFDELIKSGLVLLLLYEKQLVNVCYPSIKMRFEFGKRQFMTLNMFNKIEKLQSIPPIDMNIYVYVNEDLKFWSFDIIN